MIVVGVMQLEVKWVKLERVCKLDLLQVHTTDIGL